MKNNGKKDWTDIVELAILIGALVIVYAIDAFT